MKKKKEHDFQNRKAVKTLLSMLNCTGIWSGSCANTWQTKNIFSRISDLCSMKKRILPFIFGLNATDTLQRPGDINIAQLAASAALGSCFVQIVIGLVETITTITWSKVRTEFLATGLAYQSQLLPVHVRSFLWMPKRNIFCILNLLSTLFHRHTDSKFTLFWKWLC